MGNESINLGVRVEDHVAIVVHNANTPRDEEWETYLSCLKLNVHSQVVFTHGGGPNARQRNLGTTRAKQVFVANGHAIPRTAVMTTSSAMRGLVTAFNWLFPNRYRAFNIEDFSGAFAYAKIDPVDYPRFERLVLGMFAELGE